MAPNRAHCTSPWLTLTSPSPWTPRAKRNSIHSCPAPELLPTSELWVVVRLEPDTAETSQPSALRFKPGERSQQPSYSVAIDSEPDLGAEYLPLARLSLASLSTLSVVVHHSGCEPEPSI